MPVPPGLHQAERCSNTSRSVVTASAILITVITLVCCREIGTGVVSALRFLVDARASVKHGGHCCVSICITAYTQPCRYVYAVIQVVLQTCVAVSDAQGA